jgi:hypothetical protein
VGRLARWRTRLAADGGDAAAAAAAAEVRQMLTTILGSPGNVIDIVGTLRDHREVLQRLYSSSTAIVENAGHDFGGALADREKTDLIAFLATL